MKVLGSYLREKRKNLKLSIQDVADKLNLKYGTVANMEAGGKNPTLKQLRQYSLIFGCEWTQMIDDVMKITDKDMHDYNDELNAVIKDTGYDGADYSIAKQNWKNSTNEFEEFSLYFKNVMKEYDDEVAAENLKINNNIEDIINIFIKRWITKDTMKINPKDITDFREEIVHLIGLRAKHLTQK